MVAAGNAFFRSRNSLFPLAFAAIAAVSRPRAPFGNERADRWMDLAGLAVILAGQALRVAVIGLAYIRRGGKDGRIHADDLVIAGLFAHSRNPLYLGNMLVFLGLFMVLNSPAGWLIGVPFFFFAYLSITFAEEEFLGRKFGPAYGDYCRRVNRFVPSPRGLGATMRSMPFDWRRVVAREYGSTFAWITTFLALLVWERGARLGADAARDTAARAGFVWAAAIAGWAMARFMKKTGRLERRSR